jgi:hypothetical protein
MTDTPHAAIEGSLHVVDGLGVVRMQSRYETGIDDVWSALTDPERLVRWYERSVVTSMPVAASRQPSLAAGATAGAESSCAFLHESCK